MARKLTWINESISSWVCSGCSWAGPAPLIAFGNPAGDLMKAFENHKCEDHPKKKSREDVNLAVAKIVRDKR
jgi:hypothetical protein